MLPQCMLQVGVDFPLTRHSSVYSQKTNEDMASRFPLLCRPLQVPAAAKAGAIAPISVTLPKQNTGLGPEKTSFFQALAIGTKITRGTIEIMVSPSLSLYILTYLSS